MDIEIRRVNELSKKDHKTSINWAIEGMHFNRFVGNGILLKLYGKYFWYSELLKSTKIITAYYDNEIVGVLLSEMKDEEKIYKSFSKKIYVKLFELIGRIFIKKDAVSYDSTNKELLDNYLKDNKVDGEIAFLAAKPNSGIKGIGSRIIEEFEKDGKYKTVYLFTDDSCTYQFYDHRGFDRVGEKSIVLEYENLKVPIVCMLYSKKL